MAKFYGAVGFVESVETRPGGWMEEVTERKYAGELIKNTRRLQNSGQVNDNVDIANQVSIVADPFAYSNFHSMRYVTYMGTNWKITSIEVQYPRLILTIGGLYNGKQA